MLDHDGRGGEAVCGHCVVDPAVSVPGSEVGESGGGCGDRRMVTHLARSSQW